MKHYESVTIEFLNLEFQDILTLSVGDSTGSSWSFDFSDLTFS